MLNKTTYPLAVPYCILVTFFLMRLSVPLNAVKHSVWKPPFVFFYEEDPDTDAAINDLCEVLQYGKETII
ncbi:MAG: hypothetical protein LBJ13_03120 [Puniceicoccales bacterium]|jgi:hypothetical protein|nr:hypothetical protein [Puniceicoccales bacterium]